MDSSSLQNRQHECVSVADVLFQQQNKDFWVRNPGEAQQQAGHLHSASNWAETSLWDHSSCSHSVILADGAQTSQAVYSLLYRSVMSSSCETSRKQFGSSMEGGVRVTVSPPGWGALLIFASQFHEAKTKWKPVRPTSTTNHSWTLNTALQFH